MLLRLFRSRLPNRLAKTKLVTRHTSVLISMTIISLVCLSSLSFASEKINVSGFFGVGVAYTSDNNFLGKDENNASIIEFGISANYRLSNNLTLTGQAGQRKFGESFSDENLRVDFASLNYVSNALQLGEQSISIGRVKVPSGLFNTTRDVPSTRPSILLPQSVYLDIFRNSLLSTDGFIASTNNELFDGTLFIDAAAGRPRVDDRFNDAMFGSSANGKWTIDSSKSLNVRFENNDFTLGATYNEYQLDYRAELDDKVILLENVVELPVGDGQVEMNTLILSARVQLFDLEWTTEYMDRKISVIDFINTRGAVARPQEGYYTQLRYSLSQSLTVFTRWERFYRNANDKRRERETFQNVPLWSEITTSLSAGASYQVGRNWQVSAEIHEVNGSAWLPPFFLTTPEAIESKDWTLLAMQIAYRF